MSKLTRNEIIEKLELEELPYNDALKKIKQKYLFYSKTDPNFEEYFDGAEEEDAYFEDYRKNFYYTDKDIEWDSEWNYEWNNLGILITKGKFIGKGHCRVDFFSCEEAVFDGLNWSHFQRSLRDIKVQYLDSLTNRDDESTIGFPSERHSKAPMVFCFYANIMNITFKNGAIVILVGETDSIERSILSHPQNKDLNFVRGLFAPVVFNCLFSHIDDLSDSAIGYGTDGLLEHMKGTRNAIRPQIQINDIRDMQIAFAFHMQKNFKEAAFGYQKVIQSSPGFSLAYKWLTDIIFGFQDYEKTLKISEKALSVEFPKTIFLKHPVAANGGLAALALDRLDLSEKLAQAALVHNENDTTALRVLAETLIRQNKAIEAEPLLSKAIEIENSYGTATWLLGLAHYQQQNESNARVYFEKAKELDQRFVFYYDQAQTTKFLITPTSLDWISFS